MLAQYCERCGRDIPSSRLVSGISVCQCGWIDPTVEMRAYGRSQAKIVLAMIAACCAIVAAYIHLASWGRYAYEAPILKFEKTLGFLSVKGFERLGSICASLGKLDCATESYLSIYHSKGDLNGLADLGRLQLQMGKWNTANATFANYFKAGGYSYQAAVDYGESLELTDHLQKAGNYYVLAIEKSGKFLPVQATSNLVHLLIKEGQDEAALERIESFRHSAENAKGYLNTEYWNLTLKEMNRKAEEEAATQALAQALTLAQAKIQRDLASQEAESDPRRHLNGQRRDRLHHHTHDQRGNPRKGI